MAVRILPMAGGHVSSSLVAVDILSTAKGHVSSSLAAVLVLQGLPCFPSTFCCWHGVCSSEPELLQLSSISSGTIAVRDLSKIEYFEVSLSEELRDSDRFTELPV